MTSCQVQRVNILVCWRRWIPVNWQCTKKPMAALVKGFVLILVHASIVVACHCVDGDREGVRKVSIKEREWVEAVQEKMMTKDEARCSSLSWITRGSVGECTCTCVYTLCECVCLYIMTGEPLCCLCSATQRRGRRPSFSHTVFIHTTSSLLTKLLSSRHSQDLNDPLSCWEHRHTAHSKCVLQRKKSAHPLWGLCVCMSPQRIAQCPLARYLCLVNPLRAPSHGIFILLSVVSLLSLHTYTHKCTYTHSKSCVSIYLDVIVCNIMK